MKSSITKVTANINYAEADAGPDPVDSHVGARIRNLRKLMKISQEKLAKELGLTFQQVQKYERADNRIGSSRLYQIAHALGVDVQYFFEGLDGAASGMADDTKQANFGNDLMNDPNVVKMLRTYALIRDDAAQVKHFMSIIKTYETAAKK